jgi:hypothetical protein
MTRRLVYSALIGCAVVSVAAGFGRWLRPEPPAATAPPPLLSTNVDRLDFGEVWEDPRFGWSVPLTNPGPAAIVVTEVRTSCGCTAAAPTAFRVEPGKAHALQLTIDLTPKPTDPADKPRQLAVAVTVACRAEGEDRERAAVFTVRGRVRPVLETVPRVPALGERSERAPPEPVTFAVVAHTPLDALTAVSESSGYGASCRPADRPGRYVVSVHPSGLRPVGPATAVVRLVPVGPSGPLPEWRITLRGAVAPDTVAGPREVSAGSRAVDEVVEEVVTVGSLTGRVVVIEGVTAVGDGLTAERIGPIAVRVRQRVTRVGPLAGRVEVVVRADGGGSETVTVPVVGHGTASTTEGKP